MNHRSIPGDLEPACLYLRKSREDREAEERGEGETLARHRTALLRLAKDYGVGVAQIYEEIVSGESVLHRPAMLAMLKALEGREYRSVWCVEIDRLGRGDMEDQGLILKTLKKAGARIVTPRKIYDLSDEFDEEYTEFEAFMARKELKIITRRLQSGRRRAVEDGNYLGTLPPYGYCIKQTPRRRYLVKNREQAVPTELIFRLYREGLGTRKIAKELNRLGYRSFTGRAWTAPSVLNMLKNPVYAGITVWQKNEIKKSAKPGQKKEVRSRPLNEQLWVRGTHEPYVTEQEWSTLQQLLAGKSHSPYRREHGLTNPLAGLVKCGLCGGAMVARPYRNQRSHLLCYNPACPCKSTRLEYVEEKLLAGLKNWLDGYPAEFEKYRPQESGPNLAALQAQTLQALTRERRDLQQQKTRLQELLEKRIYDEATYLERCNVLARRMAEVQSALLAVEQDLGTAGGVETTRRDILPKVTKLLDIYRLLDDPAAKNQLLKAVLTHAIYIKEQHQAGDDFSLVLYPKLPQITG